MNTSPPSTSPSSPTNNSGWSSLAIFDPDRSDGDERRAMETIVYFYPESTPDNLQMNHAGLCLAVAGLSETFSQAPLEMVQTDLGVTALVQPDQGEQLWIACTVPSLYAGPNDAAQDAAADNTAAVLRAMLREAYRAFTFRFGSDAMTNSPPVVRDFFDRFSRTARPLQRNRMADAAAAFVKSDRADAFNWLLGLATCHATLPLGDYHRIRSIVGHFAPRCASYVLFSDGAVIASTAGRDVTHAASLLLSLYGCELPSFAAFPADEPGPHWCHVVHCGKQHSFFAICSESMEDDIARVSAELFVLCDEAKHGRPLTMSPTTAGLKTKRPAAYVSLNFGSRTSYCSDTVKPSIVAALCGHTRSMHDRVVPPVEPDLASGGVMMLRRAPLPVHPARPRASALDWLDTNSLDLCCLVAKDVWMVIRHANRRTVGLLYTDCVSWADISDSVEAMSAAFFHGTLSFGDIS
jgi:hypothetical protein